MPPKTSPVNGVRNSAPRRAKRPRTASPPRSSRRAAASSGRSKPAPPQRTRPPRDPEPPLNPLPAPPPHERPSLRLFSWGTGDSGQLAMGGPFLEHTVTKPRRVTYMEQKGESGVLGGPGAGLESIAAGALHSAMIDEKGTVWTCGMNDNAELGRSTATKVTGMTSVQVDAFTGDPFYLPVPIRSLVDESFRAVKVAMGDCIGAVLSDKGQVRVWGTYRTSNGDLGFAPTVPKQHTPIPFSTLSSHSFSAIAAGDNHLLLLTTTGEVYTAGSSEYSQLGRRVPERRPTLGTFPERVILGTRTHRALAVAVGAGADHSCAVDARGGVWGWGLNAHGQTGTGLPAHPTTREECLVLAPCAVPALDPDALGGGVRVVQIAGGAQHTLFLTSDGRVFACGNGTDGQLGLPDAPDDPPDDADPNVNANPANTYITHYPNKLVPTPVPIPFPFPIATDPITSIACGSHNSAAVTRAGALYVWGHDTMGQLGVGAIDVRVRVPTVIVRTAEAGGAWAAKAVACGTQHSLALLARREVPAPAPS